MQTHLLIAHASGTLTDTIKRYATLRGCRVDVVTDGLQCIARLQQIHPNALVLDDDLPCGGGNGVLDWVRQERRRLECSIVMMTERSGQEYDDPLVTYWLRKPFDISALFKVLRLALPLAGQKSGGVVSQQLGRVYLPVVVDAVLPAAIDD